MKLHVITHKEALRTEELSDKVVVVFDVLLATTTIVAALHHGARSVIPVMDEEEARHHYKTFANEEEGVLSGEWNGRTINGFLDPSPFILKDQLIGKHLILSSTNGTRAIRLARHAKTVYIGALLNAMALTDRLASAHKDQTVLLVCSGAAGGLSLEDFFGAGVFACLLQSKLSNLELTDATRIASHFASAHLHDPEQLIKESRVGEKMVKSGLEQEVCLASQIGGYREIPVLIGDQVQVNEKEIEKGRSVPKGV